MKRKLLLIFVSIALWGSTMEANTFIPVSEDWTDSIYAEIDTLKLHVGTIESKVKKNANRAMHLERENEAIKAKIDSLEAEYQALCREQGVVREDFNRRLTATNQTIDSNRTELKSDLVDHRTWGIVFVVVLLLIILVIAYYYHKKISRGSTSINEVRKAQEGLQKAQMSLQEESIKLDSKLVELIEAQISAAPQEPGSKEPDHSLALKVADEIVRMEMNLSRMDSSVKGHKQLSKAVQRIIDNFKANGYDIVDMLGKPYNEGMKVVANFVADESLDEGQRIITGITKPQINFNGQMIQAAQITVSQNI